MKMEILIPVKDFYRNIPGEGKVKELTKNKPYESRIEYSYGKKYSYSDHQTPWRHGYGPDGRPWHRGIRK